MGRRLIQQRRGRGTKAFEARKQGTDTMYLPLSDDAKNGFIVDLKKDAGRNAIVAIYGFEDNQLQEIIAAEGIKVGQNIMQGSEAPVEVGNVLFLRDIPEGCPVFNVELIPGDGGTLVRTTGNYALLVSKDEKTASLKLSSGKIKKVNINGRATIGCVSGGARKEKPFVKAGNMFHAMKAKGGRVFPRVRGVAMNAVDHPFGGSQHHPGKSKSTKRHASPGRKVGAVGSKRTGLRKKN